MLSKHWICKERDARWLVTITDDVKRTSVPGGWHCHCWGCGPLAHAQKARASAAFCDPPPRRRRRRARRSRSGQPATSEAQLTNSSCLSHARSNKSTSRNWKRNKQRWARKNDEHPPPCLTLPTWDQNLHWKLGWLMPSFGSILAVRLKKYFF